MLATPADLALVVLCVLIAINAMTWTLLAFDKAQARRGDRRIPETTLLIWMFLGGTPGGFAARHVFRHKIHKQLFVSLMRWIATAHCLLLAGFVWWYLSGPAPAF